MFFKLPRQNDNKKIKENFDRKKKLTRSHNFDHDIFKIRFALSIGKTIHGIEVHLIVFRLSGNK